MKLFFAIFMFSFVTVKAQKTLMVEYKYLGEGQSEWSKPRMLLNDATVHIHHFGYGLDVYGMKKKIGNKLINHAYYYDLINKKYYYHVNLSKQQRYLVPIDTSEYPSWKFTGAEKIIEGYNCKAFLSINKTGDSTLVYTTNELKYKNGFLFYYGVPGVVLEAYSQRIIQGNARTVHIIATKIKETDNIILRPEKARIVTKEENAIMMAERRRKMENERINIRVSKPVRQVGG